MEDTHHTQPCHTLGQLPTSVWTCACKHLRFKDLDRLLHTHPNVEQACIQRFHRLRPVFTLQHNDSSGTRPVNRDHLSAGRMAVLQRLGRHFRHVLFQTQSFHLAPDTFGRMKRVLVTESSALRSLEISFCDESSFCFFDSGTGYDWHGFLHSCVTARPYVRIELNLHVFCLPPLTQSSYYHQTPSDPRCRFLTSLLIEERLERVHCPDKPFSDILLLLAKFPNLRELDLTVYYVADVLLSRLAQENKALRTFHINYTSFQHGVMHSVSAEAWRELAAALPLLRVRCNLGIRTVRDDTFDDLYKVFKPSTPMTALTVSYPEPQSFPQLLTWCHTFAGTMQLLSVKMALDVGNCVPDAVVKAVDDFCGGSSCLRLLDATHSPAETKDMMILAFIASSIRNGQTTECTKRKEQTDRQKSRSSYTVMSRSVCSKTLCKLVCIGDQKLKTLCKHFKEFGLVPRKLMSGGRKNNTKALAFADNERVVDFVKGYARHHAICLPGRVPGFKRDDIQLLPSSETKSRIYRQYRSSCQNAGHRFVGASTFRKLWLQLCPYIVVMRPSTDLCWRCQQNTSKLFHGFHLLLEQKQALMDEHQRHLSAVDAERQLYRDMVASSKATVAEHGFADLGPSVPNSRDITLHYSFDFAQQVHFPSWPDQPGPMYFLTPRKCGIFGICCEGFPKQVNYLIDESVNVSKGSNGVISYLHHFFENFALGEKHVSLHCDNCSGQNKNKFVIWYCAWRVMRGLHTTITINFMPPGHTKFAPDWCFGLLKRNFRRTPVHCLQDLCQVVYDSTPESKVNIPQLVGREDWSVLVPTFDWQSYLKPACIDFKGIKKIAHFRFSAEQPGFVHFKTGLAEEEETKQLVKPAEYQRLAAMPLKLLPPKLDFARQSYLFKSIREFVSDDHKDTVCPPPREDDHPIN